MSNENYTLTNIIRTGLSPFSSLIGTSSYYGQILKNPILGTINSLLFSKKLSIDIWNLNQNPSNKTKFWNTSKKILLGLGTISLVNYAKFSNNILEPINTTTLNPFIASSTLNPAFSTSTTTSTTSTTTIDPWSETPFHSRNLLSTDDETIYLDWNTFIAINNYGLANLIAGITELIPNKFENIRKIANMGTGASLVGSGIFMGIDNGFNNAAAIPTIAGGISEILHNLIPFELNYTIQMEPIDNTFPNENSNLINNAEQEYERQVPELEWDNRDIQSINNENPTCSETLPKSPSWDSIDTMTSDVLFEPIPRSERVYNPTTTRLQY